MGYGHHLVSFFWSESRTSKKPSNHKTSHETTSTKREMTLEEKCRLEEGDAHSSYDETNGLTLEEKNKLEGFDDYVERQQNTYEQQKTTSKIKETILIISLLLIVFLVVLGCFLAIFLGPE